MAKRKEPTLQELRKLGGIARAKKLKAAERQRIARLGGKAGGRGRTKNGGK